MQIETISHKLTDGDEIILPNNAENLEVTIDQQGRATFVVIHGFYTPDGRVGETTYRVHVFEDLWHDSGIEVPNMEHVEVIHDKGLKFRIVGFEVVE